MEKTVDYDKKNDILYVNKGEKVKDSLQIDDFVIDFSYDNKIVGMEILDASKEISSLIERTLDKKDLAKIKDAKISVKKGRDAIYVKLALVLLSEGEEKKEHLSLTVPSAVQAA